MSAVISGRVFDPKQLPSRDKKDPLGSFSVEGVSFLVPASSPLPPSGAQVEVVFSFRFNKVKKTIVHWADVIKVS